MTTPKCPLCGENPEYILEEGDGHCEYAGCPKCGLYAAPSWGDWNCNPNEEDTWQRWRDLVSKFPPIMRLQVGDKLILFENVRTIIELDKYQGKFRLQNDIGITWWDSDDVKVWPWELEQKRGAEQ